MAAPASTSAASRPRRCCTPPKCSTRPATRFDALGVEVGKPKLNLTKMMAHKDATVASNVNGVAFLFKKNKIDWLQRHRQGRSAPARSR